MIKTIILFLLLVVQTTLCYTSIRQYKTRRMDFKYSTKELVGCSLVATALFGIYLLTV